MAIQKSYHTPEQDSSIAQDGPNPQKRLYQYIKMDYIYPNNSLSLTRSHGGQTCLFDPGQLRSGGGDSTPGSNREKTPRGFLLPPLPWGGKVLPIVFYLDFAFDLFYYGGMNTFCIGGHLLILRAGHFKGRNEEVFIIGGKRR